MTEEGNYIKVTQMSPEELDDLAKKIVTNVVYIANSEEAVRCSFGMLIAFLNEDVLPKPEVEKIGAMWEEWSKAGPRSINGYPFFFSGHLLHKDDLAPLAAAVEVKEKALSATLPKP